MSVEEESDEYRQECEALLEHDMTMAARFLLANESLPQAQARLGNLAVALDYPEMEVPF